MHFMLFGHFNLQPVSSLVDKGGVLMLPLFFLSLLGVWIFLDRLVQFYRAAGRPEELFVAVRECIEKHDWEQAQDHAQAQPGPVAAVFRVLLQAVSRDKGELEELALHQARHELQRLSKRLPLLNLIGGLAPLVGLLGTVVGMVKAFQQVAAAQGVVNPGILASGIWEALLTTVAGLIVAIPAVIFHHGLDQRVKRYAFEMDHYGTLLLRLLCHTEPPHA
jgi:biopolymer transport protein ExbB